jgi:ABC-type transport system substrate-binding protein
VPDQPHGVGRSLLCQPAALGARAAGARYRLTPDATASTKYLQFNTARPIFANARGRRAVEYALDRRALAAIDTALPATRLLSPRLPGFNTRPIYPLHPDLRRARRLSGGRRFHAVFATLASSFGPRQAALAPAVREQLAAAGISLTVLSLTARDFQDGDADVKEARADLIWGGGNVNDGDPVSYLRSLHLPSPDRSKLERIATLSSPAREQAAAALASRRVAFPQLSGPIRRKSKARGASSDNRISPL